MNKDLENLRNHTEWNESYYFNFHDEKNDLTAFMRIGNKVNKNEKMMFFYLMSSHLMAGIKLETNCDNKPLNIAGLNYREIKPGIWDLRYTGPIFNPLDKTEYRIKMDVKWETLNPIMDYMDCVDNKGIELSKTVASGHIEQFGKATGRIIIDDEVFDIDGLGERDKSVGVRAWGSPEMWMWINSAFSESEAFNITKLSVRDGEVNAGYFHTNSMNKPLIKSDIDVEYYEGIPTRFSMNLIDAECNEYPVTGEVVRYGMIPVDENMNLIETLSRYTWKGKYGYGIAEFLIPRS